VQAIISMAHALGHQLVAEGVETDDQLAHLRDLDCDLLQGFLLSRPVAPELVPDLVATRHEAFSRFPSVEDGSLLLPFDGNDIFADSAQAELV